MSYAVGSQAASAPAGPSRADRGPETLGRGPQCVSVMNIPPRRSIPKAAALEDSGAALPRVPATDHRRNSRPDVVAGQRGFGHWGNPRPWPVYWFCALRSARQKVRMKNAKKRLRVPDLLRPCLNATPRKLRLSPSPSTSAQTLSAKDLGPRRCRAAQTHK